MPLVTPVMVRLSVCVEPSFAIRLSLDVNVVTGILMLELLAWRETPSAAGNPAAGAARA